MPWLCALALPRAGSRSAARMAMMAMTTSSSIRVKPSRRSLRMLTGHLRYQIPARGQSVCRPNAANTRRVRAPSLHLMVDCARSETTPQGEARHVVLDLCGGFHLSARLLKYLPAMLALGLVAGCTRFHSQPLSPTETAAGLERRSLDNPGLRAFLEKNLQRELNPWPVAQWDFEMLTLAAFYYH